MSDFTDLVYRLRLRDGQAMTELYSRFGAVVYTAILRIVRNEAAAEDLAQETFLRIWNSIGSFDASRGSLPAWITAVARNRALDYLRSNDSRMERAACELDRVTHFHAEFAPAENDVFHAGRLRRALAALGTNQRAVLVLAYRDGLSQTEIAERMKRPVGTVKTWARTALKSLRAHLQVQPVSA